MRKLHVLLFAALAVFAFAAVTASSAFAFTELLFEGGQITSELAFELEGEITLQNLGAGTPAVLCSGIFVGAMQGGTTGEIKEVLDLARELLAENSLNLSLVSVGGDHVTGCVGTKTCAAEADALAVALKLPWTVHVEAPSTLLLEGVEYNLDCLVAGILFELVCSGTATATILNDPVTGDAAAAFEETAPDLLCDDGSEANALFDTGSEDTLLLHVGGGLLTWS